MSVIFRTCRLVVRCRRWVPASRSGDVPGRRKFFGRAVGVITAVLAARTGLMAALAAPARASSNSVALAESTTVEQGAVGPAVVQLTDTATIAVDASLGNDFRVTLGGSRTMRNPVNAVNGQQIIFQITQGSSGSATITWGSSYLFSSALPRPSLSTSPGQTDLLGFIYSAATSSWLLAAFVNGFS